ncbi:MAG: MATE family efflux transporter [Clostridia bacterium]|nr:MATE family efflux transporter [Clostridia bacterium]
MKAKAKPNFTTGPIFFRIFLFVIPIILTGLLQVAYNMADHIVVGQWSGDENALAAVGATGALTNLIINLLMGIATGSGIVVAQYFGAKRHDDVSATVHTAMTFAAIGGLVFMVIGLLVSRPALVLMGTPDGEEGILTKAVLYIQIICLGIPATSVYNFGAATLRSVGDSKTPLYILSASGILNVLFNLLFVIVFHMSVAGVAIATIISQYASAIAVVVVLISRRGECYALSLKKLGIRKKHFLRVLRFGIPTGLQSTLFSITNVLITSAANVLDPIVLNARTIAANIDNITYISMNAYSHAAMTFVGQNRGADKNERINRIFRYLIIQVLAVGILTGVVLRLLGPEISSFFIEAGDPHKAEKIGYVIETMNVILLTYFLCGLMETLSGVLRALDHTILSVVASFVGLVVRTAWVLCVFPIERFRNLTGLYLSYPISWIISISIAFGCCAYVWKKLEINKKAKLEKEAMKLA